MINILATTLQILAALLMAFVWAAFLRKTDIFRPEKWYKILVAFLFGCTTPFLVLLINATGTVYSESRIVQQFIFCTVNIGLVEESCKFLGFLLFYIIFRKWFDEEINFLIYGSTIALGFATVENCMYFFKYGIYLVYIRGLMSTYIHMGCTSIITSMFGVGIRKKGFFIPVYLIGGLIIASVFHGVFDAILFINIPLFSQIFSALVFLVVIELWSQTSNNFLNRSHYYQKNIAIDRNTLQRFLIVAFILAGAIQLVGLIIAEGFYDGLIANFILLAEELILTIILVTRIARHTVIPGYWKPIYPLLPFKLKIDPIIPGSSNSRTFLGFKIRGDEFNEYPFTTRVNKLSQLLVFRDKRFDEKENYQCWILDKVFIGKKKELFYLCELTTNRFKDPGVHPTHFLIKPKLSGAKRFKGYPIVGIITLSTTVNIENIDIHHASFLRWAVLQDTEKESFSQTWKEMIV